MSIYRQRDIVLVPFPFSDLSGHKVRPVLILSNDAYNQRAPDVLVCSMTSRMIVAPYSVFINDADVEQPGTLNHPGRIRADRISSLHQSLLIRRVARLKRSVFSQVVSEIDKLLK